MIMATEDELKKELQKGYSSGYQAGIKAASEVDSGKVETYNVIVTQIAKMYLDNGYGIKKNGVHVNLRPEECFAEAIKHANQLIKKVSIK